MWRSLVPVVAHILLLLILLTGCNQPSTPVTPLPKETPSPLPAPSTDSPAPDPAPPDATPPKFKLEEGTLRALARDLNIDWGTEVRIYGGATGDSLYMDAIPRHFNLIVFGGVMNMVNIQPQKGIWDFTRVDRMLQYAESYGLKIRWQSLIYGYPQYSTGDWHPTPEWVRTGDFTREEMITIMNDHITEVMNHYGNRIAVWAVVNEPLTKTGLKKCVWKDKLGEDYVELAFKMARECNPDTVLCLNEVEADYIGQSGKHDRFYQYVRGLVEKEIPIDAVGLQFHLAVPEYSYHTEPSIDKILSNINRYTDLGLDVLITELDVRIREPITPEKLEKQAEVYSTVIDAALQSGSCKSITVWGYTDKYSWNPDSEYSHPCIFDENLEPKPAYYAVRETMEKYLNN